MVLDSSLISSLSCFHNSWFWFLSLLEKNLTPSNTFSFQMFETTRFSWLSVCCEANRRGASGGDTETSAELWNMKIPKSSILSGLRSGLIQIFRSDQTLIPRLVEAGLNLSEATWRRTNTEAPIISPMKSKTRTRVGSVGAFSRPLQTTKDTQAPSGPARGPRVRPPSFTV